MFRKLGIGFTALALLVPGLASALGLGEYETDSYLNQPLDMEVELLDTGDLAPEEIIVSLASQRDFDTAGVDRLYFLNDLTFEVELHNDGTGTLHIRSNQPVREPYLNFLVEVLWPTGRLLREYTILLDPPSYDDEAAGQAEAPARQTPEEVTPEQTQAQPQADQPAEARISAPAPATQSVREPAPADREEYVVQASDTMWRIALNNRPAQSISVQQMLMAIQELNPEAFIDGNVNLVREGTVLRLPTEEEVRRISTREALSQVAEQNRQWREKLEARGIRIPTRAQVDATARAGERRTGTAGTPDSGRVTLVSPESAGTSGEGRGTGASGEGSGDARALENELVIRDESLDRLKRENDELTSRVDDLRQQVETSEKLLQLRNDQITRLQEQLRQLQGGKAGEAPVVVEPVEPVQSVSPTTEKAEPEASAQPEVAGQPDTATAPAGGAPAAGADAQGQVAQGGDQAADAAAPAAEPRPEAAKPRPKPVVPPAAPVEDDNLPLLIAAGAGLLLLVLGGLVILARRRKQAAQADEEEYDDYEAEDDFLAPVGDGGDAHDDQDLMLGDFPEEEGAAPDQAHDAGQDPLEEVDVYTAYGRLAEAVAFLKNEIHKAPSRSDLKIRLLEVLAEMHDSQGFEREASAFASDPKVRARADALRPQLGGGAAAGAVAGAAASRESEPSLDDLEFDLAADMEPKRPGADDPIEFVSSSTAADDEDAGDETLILDSGDDGMDLDLSFGEEQGGAADEFSLEDDSTLSLDMEDDESAAPVEDKAEAEELAAALDIDAALDLDGSGESTGEDVDFGDIALADASDEFQEVAERPAAEELDLSLDDLELDSGSDLSLEEPAADELELDTGSELSLEETAGDDLELSLEDDFTEEPELSLEDDATSDDFDLSLEDDAPTAVGLSALDEPAATTQRPAVDGARTEARPAVAESSELSLGGDEDDFDFLGDTDENATKLDLAKAYIDMGDAEGARDILNEVLSEGNSQQQQEAKELLAQVG